ncbi:hypothetical protein M409DRAFT_63695 [Zasmidium cellare ATCC 36951]|uniref:CoA-transferase family III n=1 Tax=Zasmidium cellare ATCC 36951 TaxID=1080233 RepID=A0A6A6CYY0_ZASCE|nr:uncharacterized protein M409DRAFT_63695 [Zasmidium cellare ATCC 36951]KAF2171400.1 hypothetical protein M409DRAFT_63695 [Zasmidium cellare ATCC 36951]
MLQPHHPPVEQIFHDLLAFLSIPSRDSAPNIQGQDPLTPSPHRIGDAMAAALATLGTTLTNLWDLRTKQKSQETFSISTQNCIAQLMAAFFTTTNGVSCMDLMDDAKLLGNNDFFQAQGGRWVFLLTTYPELRDMACWVLGGVASEREVFEREVAKWDAFELEREISERGGCCVVVRSAEEWRGCEVGRGLVGKDVVEIEKLGEAEGEVLRGVRDVGEGTPLEGVRVLDNTHVIAGPMAARMAAEFGADVLSMAAPKHRDPFGMIVETGIGKRSAWCDLEKEEDQAKFWQTVEGADVYMSSYLSLEKKGFGAKEIAKRRPGIVIVEFHAWGSKGPWKDWGGFDQLACSATGFSQGEGGTGKPSLPPTHLLNDYLAATLGAAAMVECLRRREIAGGTWRVEVNLSRICMWVQSLGMFERDVVAHLAKPDIPKLKEVVGMKTVSGRLGETRYLPTQIQFHGAMKPGFEAGAEPWGVSKMAWL